MEPGDPGGLGSSGVAVAAALIVAIAVLVMVSIGGVMTRPLVTPHVAMAPRAQSQG